MIVSPWQTVWILLLATVGMTCVPARADLAVYEGFDYGEGSITDQAGGAGWEGAWGGAPNDVLPESLKAGYGETPKTSGGSLSLTKADWGSMRRLASALGEKPGIYYISFLLKNNTGISHENYGALTFTPAEEEKGAGFGFGQEYFGDKWAIIAPQAVKTGGASADPAFFVAKVVYAEEPGADKVLLYVDPELAAEPAAPDAEVSGTDLAPVKVVTLRSKQPFTFDELRVGTTWADVCPKP